MPATDGVIINNVTFDPGARTFWHSHEHGQILDVIVGPRARSASEAKPPHARARATGSGSRRANATGTAPRPTTFMTHTAISLGATQWSDEVTAEDYARHPEPKTPQ